DRHRRPGSAALPAQLAALAQAEELRRAAVPLSVWLDQGAGWTPRSTSTRLVWSDTGAWKMLCSLPPYGRLPLRCLQFRRVDVAEHVHAFGAVRCAWKMLRSLPP